MCRVYAILILVLYSYLQLLTTIWRYTMDYFLDDMKIVSELLLKVDEQMKSNEFEVTNFVESTGRYGSNLVVSAKILLDKGVEFDFRLEDAVQTKVSFSNGAYRVEPSGSRHQFTEEGKLFWRLIYGIRERTRDMVRKNKKNCINNENKELIAALS